MDELFKQYYYSENNILSNNDLWKNKITKDKDYDPKTIKKKDYDFWLDQQENHQTTKTQHKPQAQHMHPIVARANTYQSDLMYYDSIAGINKGYSAIINFVEITTRKAYSYKLQGKTAEEVYVAFQDFYKKVNTLRCLEIDKGTEYSKVKTFCEKEGVTVIVYNGDKNSMSIAERFNRSLRNFVLKVCKNKVWYKKLDDILEAYNERIHSSTGYSPDYLSKHPEIQDEVRSESIQQIVDVKNELNKFKVGDTVRVYEKKKLFGKGTGSYSKAVHTITAINGNSIFFDHNPEKKYRYYNIMKVGKVDLDPRTIAIDEANVEEANYKVARKLNKELSINKKSVKEFNVELQNQNKDDTLGKGKRIKKAPDLFY